ncbi:MAG: NUDIX domain-containing protein [Magnetococcales bacterium]|nr:NUDIX domain-containing protein [Magnetococcales bacterium]MBF0321932.1 NUDIX domain-containing protein [Magnetococcales bacterium]
MAMMRYCPLCAQALIEREMEGRVRQACPGLGCDFVHWDNPVPVVAGIVEVARGVVLAHNKAWLPGKYSVITGFLERGESPEEGVRRECREELGLQPLFVALVGLYPYVRANQVIIAYHLSAEGEIVLGEELDDYKIIPKRKLKGWDFGTGLAVTDWLKRG